MDKKDDLIIRLRQAHEFIYKIKGEFYVIGATVCRVCTACEKELYSKYESELNNAKEIYKQRSRSDEYYRLQEYEAKGVVCSYNNIINIIKAEYSDQKKKNARVQIETLLQDLNETEIDDIEQQIKHRICVSRYYDRDKICNFN